MDEDRLFALIAVERRRAADMFAGLDEQQLATRTLCPAWTARDMAGHLALPFVSSMPTMILGMIKNRGSFDRWSAKASREVGARPVEEIVQILRDRAESRWTPPGNGAIAPLTDLCLHVRDVARPLGLDIDAPIETWRLVLDFVVSPTSRRAFMPRGRVDGLALSAIDLDWSRGTGDEVTGPAEALAMAVAGRSSALDDLTGDGVPVLRSRL
jgi:uncharacterized protein (TIGR03083 family)